MAFAYVPEYPDGTLAYFTTIHVDASGTELDGVVVFPFTVGLRFFGIVDRGITRPNAVIIVP